MNDPQHLLPPRPDQTVILLVDDEPMVRNVARITLESEGYFILAAGNGAEALLLARAYPGTIHLLLTDIVMPGGDGLELRERMMQERPATRVLLMSGQVEIPVESEFLRKPFGPEGLKDRVRQVLSRGRTADGVTRVRT